MQSAFTFSFYTDLMSVVMRTNNQQGELFRQLALDMSCDERKCPSVPSKPAERKTNRLKKRPEKCLLLIYQIKLAKIVKM